MREDDALIWFGGDVKAQGEGRFAGYVIRWGDPNSADSQGEFFTPETDFWGRTTAPLAYHHGLPLKGDRLSKRFGKRRITDVEIKANPVGLWCQGCLNLADADEAVLYERITKGEMGFSSGSTDRFVTRTPEGGKVRIDSWPLLECSITPKPIEPRNRAVAMKSLLADEAEAGGVVTASLVDRAEALVTDAEEIVALFGKAANQRHDRGRRLPEPKREAMKALGGSLMALYDATSAGPDSQTLAALQRKLTAYRIRGHHA